MIDTFKIGTDPVTGSLLTAIAPQTDPNNASHLLPLISLAQAIQNISGHLSAVQYSITCHNNFPSTLVCLFQAHKISAVGA